MLQALATAAEQVSVDDTVRVVVINADGDDFSVGADLQTLAALEAQTLQEQRREAELGGRLLQTLRDIRQPTIAAIQGVATGGGACIATACDFRIACNDARMGYGEVRMAMNLMWQALPLCVQLIGPSRAKQMIMSGRLFPADTLHHWGFVDALCAPEALSSEVQKWAEEYAALPPVAVQMIKRSVNRYAGALDSAIMHADSDQWLLAAQSEDFREAVAAFMEKREPVFNGN
jgi:enoyl-CoA hydratase/carnithine racemase